jgi:DNA-binding transcriptional MerR regulator/methylmalonyl-CoA mutase cobalamin-binding subunit
MVNRVEDEPATGKHPIQVVANRTGLTADVIRVWERRYKAVCPRRTDSNRRLYSDQDVDRLRLLRKATEAGRSISSVAGLDTEALRALVESDITETRHADKQVAGGNEQAASRHVETCLRAVEAVDAARLQAALRDASVELSIPSLFEHVLLPLLRAVGERWEKGSLRIHHEHLVSGAVRPLLESLRDSHQRPFAGPALVIATPPGSQHELGGLMVAVIAASEAWRVVYLGSDLPAEEIAAAARRADASAVGLSVVYPPGSRELSEQLRTLRALLPERTTLLVGGLAAESYDDTLREIAAVRVDDLAGLRRELRRLRADSRS